MSKTSDNGLCTREWDGYIISNILFEDSSRPPHKGRWPRFQKTEENKYNVQKVLVKVSWNELFHPQDVLFLDASLDKKEKK